MKKSVEATKTRKAYFLNKDGSKQWFDIPKDTAEKVLRLQQMFKQDAEKKEVVQPHFINKKSC